MSDEPLLNTVRLIIADGCACDRWCEEHEHRDCGCHNDAERIIALVAPAAAAAERERIRASVTAREAHWEGLMLANADKPAGSTLYAAMASAANDIALTCIDPDTSSEAGQRLGCASEGEANASSSDNPST